MSKNSLPNLTYDERKKLASEVKALRVAAGLKQAELAELAGITRQTLSNIERGAVPQIDNLRRIYEVLGVDIAPIEFSEGTQQWLAILGGILDSLPEEQRTAAGKAAVSAVTSHLTANRTSNVIVGGFGQTAGTQERKAAFDAKKIKRRDDDSEFFE